MKMQKKIFGIVTTTMIATTAAFTMSCSHSSQGLDNASVQKDIQELNIYELREKYGDTSSYAYVYWIDNETLHVTIGNKEVDLTPEEAVKQYSDNPFFQAEYENLMNAAKVAGIANYEIGITNEKEDEDINNNAIKSDIDIDSIRTATNSKIQEIMTELELHESENVMEQLQACCRLQKYIAIHNGYDNSIMEQKTQYPDEYMIDMDLYNAVVLENGVCTSNSIEMCEILSRINIKAECVGLISKDNGAIHMAVLIELMGEYYYFDPTLERAIWQENTDGNPDSICLCAAGLGEEEYCQFYTPQAIVPRNVQDNVSELPENVAAHRIPQSVVQSSL